MSRMSLFHGSSDIIKKPEYGKGKKYNDYGQGFYCTEYIELAKEWACTEGIDGYANHYEIETEDLKILDLTSEKYSILNWLAILLDNRIVKMTTPIEKKGREYLLENFLPDYKDFDVIFGYRADDSYFSFARAFVGNGISLRQLQYSMKLGKLGEQFVLKSQKAFDKIKFIDYTIADNRIYYVKRKERDDQARVNYLNELSVDDINGIYMRDIIRESIKSDDKRIR